MQIRLVGTPEETTAAATLIGTVLTVLEDSGPRPRRKSDQVQRYLEVRLPPVPPPVRPDPPAPRTSRRDPRPAEGDRPPEEVIDLREWT